MVNEILDASGIQYRRTRFQGPKPGTYAVYTDDVATDGPDGLNLIKTHDITIELYESQPDDAAEEALEAAMDAAGVRWKKRDRFWLQQEQKYQNIYEFTYITKRRV